MSIKVFRPRQGGVTLVEQIVFIVVVSVGVIGLLSTMGPSLRFSADPQMRKQQLAIAESLLAEILHQPFTYCDPDDEPAASTATSYDECSVSQDNVDHASPNTESRLGTDPGSQYDNVADYAGYSQTNVTDLVSGTDVAGFTAQIAIVRAGTDFGLADNSAALKVTVTVTGNGADALSLTGYRFRYAPRY